MSTAVHLLKLPDDIMCEIFTGWLDMEPCARLDSACCNKGLRDNIMDIMKRVCVFKDVTFSASKILYMNWVCLRSIRSSRALIANCKVGCAQYLDLFQQYLQTSSSIVSTIEVEESSSDTLDLIALYCTNLSCLRVLDCDLDNSFWNILAGNSRTLHSLHLAASDFVMASAEEYNLVCYTLQSLCIDDPYGFIADTDLIHIVKLFPNVETLHLWKDNVADETITTIVNYCSKIVDLTVFISQECVPASVLISILNNRETGYIALNLSSFTTNEEAIAAITTYHAHSLLRLKLYANATVKNFSYIQLLNACTALQTLNFSGSETDKLCKVLPNLTLPKLKQLEVDSSEEFLLDSVVEMTHSTPSLEVLTVTIMFESPDADPRIPELVQQCGRSCPTLRKILVDGYHNNDCYTREHGQQLFQLTNERACL